MNETSREKAALELLRFKLVAKVDDNYRLTYEDLSEIMLVGGMEPLPEPKEPTDPWGPTLEDAELQDFYYREVLPELEERRKQEGETV